MTTLTQAPGPVAAPGRPRLSTRWSRPEIVGVALLTAAVLATASWRLGRLSLSGDEASTWAISGHGLANLLRVLGHSGGDRAAALYYLAVTGWARIVGTGPIALRSLSVGAAALTVAPLHAIGRRLSRRHAIVTDLLLATSPFFLTYAREARAYALVTLLVVLATWQFLRAWDRDRPRDWALYVVLAVIATYTQWFAALVVVAHLATLPTIRSRVDGQSARAWRSFAAIGACCAPIAALVMAGRTGGLDWIAPLNGGQLRMLGATYVGNTQIVAQLAFGAGTLVGVAAAVRAARERRDSSEARPWVLAVASCLLPVLLAVAVSVGKPVLVPRYLIVAAPGFLLVLACGIVGLARSSKWLTAVLVAGVVVAGVPGDGPVFASHRVDEDWRGVAALVARELRPGDAIVVFPATARYGFAYYARDASALARRGGPDWPPGPWSTPFRPSPAEQGVVLWAAGTSATRVWLVVRSPGGPAVRRGTGDPAALVATERLLAAKFADREVVPFTRGHTLSVTRYERWPRS